MHFIVGFGFLHHSCDSDGLHGCFTQCVQLEMPSLAVILEKYDSCRVCVDVRVVLLAMVVFAVCMSELDCNVNQQRSRMDRGRLCAVHAVRMV